MFNKNHETSRKNHETLPVRVHSFNFVVASLAFYFKPTCDFDITLSFRNERMID